MVIMSFLARMDRQNLQCLSNKECCHSPERDSQEKETINSLLVLQFLAFYMQKKICGPI